MTAVPPPPERIQDLGPASVIILCGGMGKRMREETQGRTSKVQLPIALPRCPDGREASETVIGMLVRTLAGYPTLQEILLLTSETWLKAHAQLAGELAARYHVDVQCRSDTASGDEFPPSALTELIEQIGRRIDRGHATILVNGDTLFGPQGLRSFVDAILAEDPLMAMGEADRIDYLGLFYFSRGLKWHQLTGEIAAMTAAGLIGGLWERLSVLTAKVEGPVYDCGSPDGYRTACADGRSGKLW
jgi:hypothetical protein